MDKVSVIIPIYNNADTIKRCLDSILDQTYKNIEIIIVNDGSTDNVENILKLYSNNSNIIIFNNNNYGVSYSRNYGIQNATGKYIAFVDGDDTIDKNFIEEAINISDKYNADIVCGELNRVDKKYNNKIGNKNNKADNLSITEINDIDNLLHCMITNSNYRNINTEVFGYACGKLYKRNIIKTKFNECIRYREDYIFNLNNFSNAKSIVYMKKNTYNYYINANTASFKYFPNYYDEIKSFNEETMNVIKNNKLPVNDVYVAQIFMYVNYLKHYCLHKNILISEQIKMVKGTYTNLIWKKAFENVSMKELKKKYKLIRFFYINKLTLGTILIFYINRVSR